MTEATCLGQAVITAFLSFVTTGHIHNSSLTEGPDKEHATAKNQPGGCGRGQRREETTNLPEVLTLESILAERCVATRKDLESDQIWAKQDDWPETNLITIKPETASSMESSCLGSPYPAALCPGAPSQ